MNDDDVAVFDRHRSLLFTLAYELLGSVADAEDMVQDAYLRWSGRPAGPVENPRAYLARVVTRLSLNRLRTLARRREDYVGPWLPEPLLTSPDVADDVVLADSVSLALLVVLESLGPRERAVFVLREVFGYSHDEIARAIGSTAAAVRQLAHRARQHVEARRPRFATDEATAERVRAEFTHTTLTGDLQGLMDVLAPDVVLLSDGGGLVSAARRPIRGADPVARFLLGVVAKAGDGAIASQLERAVVNGWPGWLTRAGEQVTSAIQVVVADGRITQILMVNNPEKLDALTRARRLSR
ncbi:RNA polymerase sigma-70 factor [Micropruina sp.]|uniref:RNA polymerase sigma-70 factor n=1 Tax=Micropruina sp. TaxID=2737536 RepID=UPI0026079BCF|nr:RNA polymerase sigma-70 factor [Micropruina sp.]